MSPPNEVLPVALRMRKSKKGYHEDQTNNVTKSNEYITISKYYPKLLFVDDSGEPWYIECHQKVIPQRKLQSGEIFPVENQRRRRRLLRPL
jgi:hypothetical protein